MNEIIEQTFEFKRSIIKNGSIQFFDLLEQFKYLTDIKNVRCFVLIFCSHHHYNHLFFKAGNRFFTADKEANA